MALFKISKGKSNNLPTNKVDGYCYVTTNDHKFYVDYTKDDGTLDRFALNAVYADTAQKLGIINVGNSSKPIYLEEGTPKECVDFLPLSAGKNKKLIGPLGLTENINYGTSLPDEGFVGQLFFVEDENLDGPSLPIGGTAGQVLTKNSSEDGDASWTTNIAGNAGTATKLATARTISLTGSVTGSGTFDGSDNLSIDTTTNHTHSYLPLSGGTITGNLTINNSNSPGGYVSIYEDGEGGTIRIGSKNGTYNWEMDAYNDSTFRIFSDGSGSYKFFTFNGSNGDLNAASFTGALKGNADTATKLATARTISLTGDVTGSVNFNGSQDVTLTATVADNSHNHSQMVNFTLGTGGTAPYIYNENGKLCVRVSPDGSSYNYTWINTDGSIQAPKVYGAVWNDYAEFRICKDNFKPGQVVCENNNDTLSISTYRLQPGANIVSDTFGFAIGETDEAKCPIAVSGRVLAYTYEPREEFNAGDAVCAGPNGTVSKMTRKEIKEYPERIIGTVSAVPNYETWCSGNVPVNGRIWIKVR